MIRIHSAIDGACLFEFRRGEFNGRHPMFVLDESFICMVVSELQQSIPWHSVRTRCFWQHQATQGLSISFA